MDNVEYDETNQTVKPIINPKRNTVVVNNPEL